MTGISNRQDRKEYPDYAEDIKQSQDLIGTSGVPPARVTRSTPDRVALVSTIPFFLRASCALRKD